MDTPPSDFKVTFFEHRNYSTAEIVLALAAQVRPFGNFQLAGQIIVVHRVNPYRVNSLCHRVPCELTVTCGQIMIQVLAAAGHTNKYDVAAARTQFFAEWSKDLRRRLPVRQYNRYDLRVNQCCIG